MNQTLIDNIMANTELSMSAKMVALNGLGMATGHIAKMFDKPYPQVRNTVKSYCDRHNYVYKSNSNRGNAVDVVKALAGTEEGKVIAANLSARKA